MQDFGYEVIKAVEYDDGCIMKKDTITSLITTLPLKAKEITLQNRTLQLFNT